MSQLAPQQHQQLIDEAQAWAEATRDPEMRRICERIAQGWRELDEVRAEAARLKTLLKSI